jgi:putative PIN family toxin of toxin-antitoxin system
VGQESVRKIRAVLDTNVIVSALLFEGETSRLMDHWKQGRLALILSPEIFAEIVRVLSYPKFQLEEGEIKTLLEEEILPYAEIVHLKSKRKKYARDPEDDRFIHAALAGNADFIISGDRHLLELKNPPLPIKSVREVLDFLSRRSL